MYSNSLKLKLKGLQTMLQHCEPKNYAPAYQKLLFKGIRVVWHFNICFVTLTDHLLSSGHDSGFFMWTNSVLCEKIEFV